MLDPVTLDQLRMLAAVVEEGSFSAAARKLRRVQSAVSTAMANLEGQLGVPLWDRSQRAATPTAEGKAVLGVARRVLAEVDSLRGLAAGLVMGVESSVSLCVDALFPLPVLVELCRGFATAFPAVDLRVDIEAMTAVADRVLDRGASLGVATPFARAPELERRALAPIQMIPVVGARHPLAGHRGPVPHATLAEHVQIVLSERASKGMPDVAVVSSRTWRVVDLATKHALLAAGLGWGNLPSHLVRRDLASGRLVRIRPEGWADDQYTVHFAAVFRRDAALGPAHRWLIDHLGTLCEQERAVTARRRRRPGRGRARPAARRRGRAPR